MRKTNTKPAGTHKLAQETVAYIKERNKNIHPLSKEEKKELSGTLRLNKKKKLKLS